MAKSKTKTAKTKSINAQASDNENFINSNDASLNDFFLSELKEMYWAENHLVKSLPKMIGAASSDDLKKALSDHLEVTKIHVERIDQIFESIGENNLAKKCDALEGLVMSGEHAIENTAAGTTIRDTGIISSGLKVENFETTAYQGLIKLADKLGKSDVVALLQENMREEQEASDLLNQLSEKI